MYLYNFEFEMHLFASETQFGFRLYEQGLHLLYHFFVLFWTKQAKSAKMHLHLVIKQTLLSKVTY